MPESERSALFDGVDRDDKTATHGPVLTRTLLGLNGWDLTRPPRMVGDSFDLYLMHPQRGLLADSYG